MNVPLQVAAEDTSGMADQMGRWLDRVLGPDYQRYRGEGAWRPSINLYEDGESYHLVADLAGIEPETMDLRAEKGRLILRGQRPSPRPPGGEAGQASASGSLRLHLMEIDHGPFQRTLELPEAVDAERIEAHYRHGFLWVKMPKEGRRP